MIQRFHLTFILFLTFYEASAKNWKESLIVFQCQDCDTTFSYYIDFVPDFSTKKFEGAFNYVFDYTLGDCLTSWKI